MTRKLFCVLLLFLFLPAIALAATSAELTETRTDTDTGYTITYMQDGVPTLATDKGYASIQRVVENGRVVEERYFGAEGQPVTIGGYHIRRNVYEGSGLIRIEYCDSSGKLVRNTSGYAILTRTLDEQNRVVQEAYFDEHGDPVALYGGQYGFRYDEYNERNWVIRFTYLGADGNPIMLTSGYSSVYRSYDEVGYSKVEMFFSTTGEPVALSLGQYGRQYIRSETGRHIGTIYLDADGSPMTTNQGYGIIRYDYDEWNNITKYSYYDLDGNPVALGRGQYAMVYEYQQKQLIRTYYVDANGRELFLLDQYLMSHPPIVILAVILLCALTLLLPKRGRIALLLLYVLFIFYMTLLVRESGEQRKNFELFWSYRQLFTNESLTWDVINNILLFVPLGMLIYAIDPRLLFIAPLLTVFIEATQYFGGFGLCELDDVFGNTLGGVLGWLLIWLIKKIKRP